MGSVLNAPHSGRILFSVPVLTAALFATQMKFPNWIDIHTENLTFQ
jgi:hypothetical protein